MPMTPIFGPRDPLAMTFTLQFLSKLTIGRKLALIGAMFALPLAFLLYSVIAEKSIAIDFARKEISGNHFLAALTTAQMALQRGTATRLDEVAGVRAAGSGPAGTDEIAAPAIDGIVSAAKQFDDVPVDPALATAAVDAARAFLADSANLAADQLAARHTKVAAKLRDLIARVGDQSNLILDPDLDSFYTMYAVVVTLPELTDRLMDLSVLTSAIAEKRTLSVEDRAQFMILMGQFESARQDLIKAVEAAYRGNPDGRLKAGLDPDYRAATATLNFLAAGMKGHVLQRDGLPVDAHAAAQLRDAGLTVIERVTKKAAAELDRLLQARIAGFEQRLWWTLVLAAAIALLAVALAGWIGRGISRSLAGMSTTMTELAASNLDVAIPGLERRDEVGAMAKAVQVFKENAIENQRLVEERDRQAQELKASEQKFRTLIGNIPGACYRCANDAAYTIEFMSDAIETLSGYPAAEFLGVRVRSYAGLIHPDDVAPVRQATGEAVANKRPYAIDYRIFHRDGSVRWVHDKGQGQFDDDGNLQHLDGAIFDVTGHRHLEQELARKEQLATIGTVAATVSHELRNPLAAIRNSLATVALRTRDKGLGVEPALERADRNIDRCARIIYDLLEYTQPRQLARTATDLDQWLENVLLARSLPDGITLATDLAAGSTASIDHEQFKQVIKRLIKNAVAALTSPTWHPDDRHPRQITVSSTTAGPHVRLTIGDSGPGIPADVLPRVFEPLFTTRNFGAGLGLPITRQIVEQHGGTIAIESPPDGGTAVTISLPRLAQQAAA
jgi:PAS domain S-box-containing protein